MWTKPVFMQDRLGDNMVQNQDQLRNILESVTQSESW